MRGCACRGTAGFAHVSCLAEQVKILYAEAEENNLDGKVLNARWLRWQKCSLCEQEYHGAVCCALGWASWKTYLGRPKLDRARLDAIRVLVSGLSAAGHHEDALSVGEAQLSMMRRFGASRNNILIAQCNLANSYRMLGRFEEVMSVRRDVYSGWLKLHGEEDESTLLAANNYANILNDMQRHAEAKELLRKTIPVARRVLGEGHILTLKMRWIYAVALFSDAAALLDNLREAVATLESVAKSWQRIFGQAHPETPKVQQALKEAREALAARVPGPTGTPSTLRVVSKFTTTYFNLSCPSRPPSALVTIGRLLPTYQIPLAAGRATRSSLLP